MTWTERAEVAFSGPYVKFAEGTEYVMKFLKEPEERKFSFKGKEKNSLEFLVEIRGVQKTMGVTSSRLVNKLVLEDRKSSLIWRTLRITATGDGPARDWIVESVIP